jgi:hypothetical protein
MSDALLRARIDALDDNLRRLEASLELFKTIYGGVPPYAALWGNMHSKVEDRVKACDNKLEQLRGAVGAATTPAAARAAWALYAEAQEESADLFQGCLEFIGGVAFRGGSGGAELSSDDEQYTSIWRVADQLMRDAAVDSFAAEWEFLTVPALEEALSESLARTVRLRFPEWTIWTLPLLTYDFGLTAIEWRKVIKNYPLQELVETQTTRLVGLDAELGKRQQGASAAAASKLERGARNWWRHRVRVLLADAFATYTTGPAYACAAIHLRFDPSMAYTGNPSYDERARVMIQSLRQLDAEQPANLYAKFIDDLEAEWTSAVDHAEPPDPRNSAGQKDLDNVLLPEFEKELKISVPSAAFYSKASWLRAFTWHVGLLEDFGKRKPLKLDLREEDKLRDVLNAAWLCRIARPEITTELTRRAPELCEALMRLRAEAQEGKSDRRRGAQEPVRG